MIPGYLKKGKVEMNSETIDNHFAKAYEILKPVINKVDEEVVEIDIYKLDRLPLDVLEVKKSAVKKSGKAFLNIINSGTNEKKFSLFEVRDDLNNILEELSKGKDAIYLAVGIDDIGITNWSNIKEIVTFREIEYFLEGIKDSKIRDG